MLRVPIPTQSEFCQLFNAMDTEPKKQSDHVARFSTEFSAAKKARELPVEIDEARYCLYRKDRAKAQPP